MYTRFQVGFTKLHARTLSGNFEKEILHMREFSSQFLDNQPEIKCSTVANWLRIHSICNSVVGSENECPLLEVPLAVTASLPK